MPVGAPRTNVGNTKVDRTSPSKAAPQTSRIPEHPLTGRLKVRGMGWVWGGAAIARTPKLWTYSGVLWFSLSVSRGCLPAPWSSPCLA